MLLVVNANTVKAIHADEALDEIAIAAEYAADSIWYRMPAAGQVPSSIGGQVPADAAMVRGAGVAWTPRAAFRFVEGEYQTDDQGLVTVAIVPPFKTLVAVQATSYETADGRCTVCNIVSQAPDKVVLRVRRSTTATLAVGALLDLLGATAAKGLRVSVRIKGT